MERCRVEEAQAKEDGLDLSDVRRGVFGKTLPWPVPMRMYAIQMRGKGSEADGTSADDRRRKTRNEKSVVSFVVCKRWRIANALQREVAAVLLEDMDENRLNVILVDAPRQRHPCHKIRVATDHNPVWYSEIAGRRGYHVRQKNRSYGSLRRKVERALNRLRDGWYDPLGLEAEILETATPFLIEAGLLYPEDADELNEAGMKRSEVANGL